MNRAASAPPAGKGRIGMDKIAARLREDRAFPGDAALLNAVAQGMQGKCLCALGEFSTMAVCHGYGTFS